MSYDQTRVLTPGKIGFNVPLDLALPIMWQRVERKLNKIPGGCWLWTGWVNNWGYGEIGCQRKNWRTHRISYLFHKGAIQPKMQVCHTCDTPTCCNPEHLWLGTNKQNHLDARAKKRCRAQKITHCPKGHAYDEHGMFKPKTGWRLCKICQRAIQRIRAGWPEELAYSLPVQPLGYTANPNKLRQQSGKENSRE